MMVSTFAVAPVTTPAALDEYRRRRETLRVKEILLVEQGLLLTRRK
jgi:hypothetical protein